MYVNIPKLVAHIKDLTEENLIKGLLREMHLKELTKDGGAAKDKWQWEKSTWSPTEKKSQYHS